MNKNTFIYRAAWQFAIICLWPNRKLSEFELLTCKLKIKQLLLNAPDSFESYTRFCMRIILFRYDSIRAKGEISLPSPYRWFNENGGFEITEQYEYIYKNKELLPRDRQLCEAVLEITEDGSEEMFRYWEKWFRMKKARTQLWLFYLYNARFSPKICIV